MSRVSKFCVLSLAAVLAVLAAPAPEVLAAKTADPSALRGVRVKQIHPDESEAAVSRGDRRVSLETGAPIALYRVGYRVDPAEAKVMASQYLRENAAALRLERADLSDLVHHATWETPAGRTVRFRQQVGGVPVYGSDIAVTLGPGSRVDFVMNGYKPALEGVSTEAGVSAEEARRAAFERLGVEGDLSFEHTRLVVYPGKEGARLAWEVKLVPVASPIGDWEVLVDARSGEIFKLVDRALYVDGNGNVFDPDPLSSAGATYGDPGFVDGSDADTTQLTGQLVNVVLRDITLAGGIHSLMGPWAEIVDFENPSTGTFSQASPTFNFTRNQQGFEAVNTYYHIDNIMRYLNVSLGLSISPYQYLGGVQFDPHGLNGQDNSHYVTSSGRLAFGEGGVDDAEDADVVIHELGHGLHDWVTVGGLSQVNGLSEGVGDFVAASYSRSLGQWLPGDPQFNWVFDWDGHNPFWNGRITNYTAVYPGGLVGQVHTDGQIWSSCMMRIWNAIGRDLTESAHWVGLGMTNSNSNQQDAAQAVLTAAVNLGHSGGDVGTMESIFQSCGYNVTAPCVATCGNGVIECTEVCDTGALGGETCASQGCAGGGILACNATCDGFDSSSCIDCPLCDNDGLCELGEDCNGCPDDCASGTTSGAVCGNGLCAAGNGENCLTCALDCNGRQNGNPGNRFCCGDGGGQNPVPCSDSRCSTGGFSCTTVPGVPGSFCCGDLTCDSGESCANCGLDCTTGAEICNDGVDNDCDLAIDCSDTDCALDPSCACFDPGASCTQNSDCCSNKCRGPAGGKTCR